MAPDRDVSRLFTSPLAAALADDLLQRFLRYVRVDTESARDREQSPSTPGQLELARILVDELRALGLDDAGVDENGYVMATLPAVAGDPPVIGLIAHLDTSPDAPGKGVEPLVHHNYDGGTIVLPHNDTVLDPDEMPTLAGKVGHDIVTSSGGTLLGADDKAGVAEIMASIAYLAANPQLPRPTLRIAFTPDEELGEGASLFNLERFSALCAYTVDGAQPGELQDETFNGSEVKVIVMGLDIHTGWATGRLVNAARLAGRIIATLPSQELTPETTSGREGFIHPFSVEAGVGKAEIRINVRDFDEARIDEYVALIRRTAEDVLATEPRAQLQIEVKHQYPNMRRHIERLPEVVEAAERALRAEGLEPIRVPIRGGTDGSVLSEMGLPTPNLFTGGSEFHSVREWASVQDMSSAAATIVRLAETWSEQAQRSPTA